MRETALVIMAAGIGSRFGGGVKQLEPVGPSGEIIMDYSIYDALEAGFNKIIFVIRRDLEHDFKEIIGKRIEQIAQVEYVYQEVDDIPAGHGDWKERTKPWGTGQAILCAKSVIQEPFLVINADDYYGKEGFKKIHHYMVNQMQENGDTYDICMGGFVLSNTLSSNGGVTRGVCQMDSNGKLSGIHETYQLKQNGDKVAGVNDAGDKVEYPFDQKVSMNMWGLSPEFLKELETGFAGFLDSLEPGDLKSEYLLPRIIDHLIQTGRADVTVLETKDHWFGVTYKEDKPVVSSAINQLIASGRYKEKLF